MLLKNYWRRRYILELIKFRFNYRYCPVKKKKINSGFFHNNFSREDELMWKYPKNIFFFIILYFNIADFDWLMFMELQFTQSSSSVNLLCTQRQICMLKNSRDFCNSIVHVVQMCIWSFAEIEEVLSLLQIEYTWWSIADKWLTG